MTVPISVFGSIGSPTFNFFTSTSNKTQTFLTKGMEDLNRTNLKNIFRDLASI